MKRIYCTRGSEPHMAYCVLSVCAKNGNERNGNMEYILYVTKTNHSVPKNIEVPTCNLIHSKSNIQHRLHPQYQNCSKGFVRHPSFLPAIHWK